MNLLLAQLQNMKILYAEDDDEVRESMAISLGFFCQNVFLANNGAKALELYKQESPNIIILDIEMPFMTGLDVAWQIRAYDLVTPILILTNHLCTNYLLPSIKLNLVDYLSKPITYEKLKNSLSECVCRINSNDTLSSCVVLDGAIYHQGLKELNIDGKSIALTKSESLMLEIFISNKNTVTSYDEIINALGEEASKDSIKSLIYRLKKKIGKELIYNIKDIGYKIKL